MLAARTPSWFFESYPSATPLGGDLRGEIHLYKSVKPFNYLNLLKPLLGKQSALLVV